MAIALFVGAFSEYAKLLGGKHSSVHLPTQLEDVGRWLVYLVLAYLALKLLFAILRWLTGG